MKEKQDNLCENCGKTKNKHYEYEGAFYCSKNPINTKKFVGKTSLGKKSKKIGILEMAKKIKNEDRKIWKQHLENEKEGKKPKGCGKRVFFMKRKGEYRWKGYLTCGKKEFLCPECSKPKNHKEKKNV